LGTSSKINNKKLAARHWVTPQAYENDSARSREKSKAAFERDVKRVFQEKSGHDSEKNGFGP